MRKNKKLDRGINKIKRKIDALIYSKKLEGKDIILFGVTKEIQQILDYFSDRSIQITALIDNSSYKAGFTVSGIPIYLPSNYLKPKRIRVAILIYSLSYYDEQAAQLSYMGYKCNEDYFFISIHPYKRKSISLMELVETSHILSGYRIYSKIMKNQKNDCLMLLLPYAGSGDTYLIAMYLRQYIEKEKIKNYVIVVNGNLVKKVLSLFSIEADVVITDKQKDRLLSAYQFFDNDIVNIKPLLFWDWRVRRHFNFCRENEHISFNDDIKYSVLGLDEAVRGKPPKFEASLDDIKLVLERHGIKKGKSVILAPYMGTDIGIRIPFVLWERLSDALVKRGYCVFTNCSSKDEIPVKGSKPVFFPLKDIVPILNEAGYFIGLRSGLCDVISTTTCKMIVLYVSITNAIPLYYFGLKRIGLNENAVELEYMDNVDELLNKILESFNQV